MRDLEVTPLRLAEMALPDFHPEAPGSDVVHGFLVRDGDARVLVDTGVGCGIALIDRLYAPDRVDLPAAFVGAGAALDQISAIVNSHLHFDHCGNNPLFPDTPIFVQRAELEAAREPGYTVVDWVDFPGARYVSVEGSRSISEHLEVRPTPGHTPGHQSLLVHSGGGVEIVVAQAAYTAAEFQRFHEASTDDAAVPEDPTLRGYLGSNATWSKESYTSSLAALLRLRPRRAFFSHDPVVWQPTA